jgi:hypothetical protein
MSKKINKIVPNKHENHLHIHKDEKDLPFLFRAVLIENYENLLRGMIVNITHETDDLYIGIFLTMRGSQVVEIPKIKCKKVERRK